MRYGLSREEVGSLSLGEWSALEGAYSEREHREDYRIATMICHMYATQGAKKIPQPHEVMPWLKKPKTPNAAPISREMLEVMTMALGGEVKVGN